MKKNRVTKGEEQKKFIADPVRVFGNPYIPKEIQRAIKPDGTVPSKNIIGVATLAADPADRKIMLVVIEYNGRQGFIPLDSFRHTPPMQQLQEIIDKKGIKNGRYIIATL